MKKSAVSLGRIGILLPLSHLIPGVGFLGGLASTILLLISYNNFTKYYNEPKIFRNYLIGFLVLLVSGITSTILIFVYFYDLISELIFDYTYFSDNFYFDEYYNYYGIIILLSLVLIIGQIVSYIFQYLAKKELSKKTQVQEFATSGIIKIIGSATSFLGIGVLVLIVGWIFEIVAFFNKQIETEDLENMN